MPRKYIKSSAVSSSASRSSASKKARRAKRAESRAAMTAQMTSISSATVYSVENKYLDTSNTQFGTCALEYLQGTNLTATAPRDPIHCLNEIAAGDDDTNRQGRRVNLKSVQIHGSCSVPSGNTSPSTKCRILLVYEKNALVASSTNGPALGDILTNYSVYGTANTVSAGSFPSVLNNPNYVILKDKSVVLGLQDLQGNAAAPCTWNFNFFVNLKGLQANYFDTGAKPPQNGGLYLITLGDEIDAAPNNYTFAWNARLRFFDP